MATELDDIFTLKEERRSLKAFRGGKPSTLSFTPAGGAELFESNSGKEKKKEKSI